jgi:uncharacterized membrane protein YbhN (UPF0104 family)
VVRLRPAAEPPPAGTAPRGIGVRRSWWPLAGAALGLVLVAAVLGLPLADEDSAHDLWASLRRTLGGFGSVRWEFLIALGVLTVLHYLCSAVALRAAAGRPLRLTEATMVQFVASVANRVTPAGAGGLAVNARYLARRGLPVPGAVGTLAGLHVLGALADLLLFTVVLAGAGGGTGGGGKVLATIGSSVSHVPGAVSRWPHFALPAGAVCVVALAAAAWILRRRRARPGAGLRFAAGALTAVVDIRRRPGDLAALLAASAGTTLMMGLAFVISVMAVPGGASIGKTGALLTAYLIGAAAGQALPVPAGMGSTEAALTAMLLAAQVPAVPAVQAVVLFRVMTFWAPVPVGALAARGLRRRGAL